jgi:hypothetical protein
MIKNYAGKNDLVFVRCKTGDAEIKNPEMFPVERKTKKPEPCLFGLFFYQERPATLLYYNFSYENFIRGVEFQVIDSTGKLT